MPSAAYVDAWGSHDCSLWTHRPDADRCRRDAVRAARHIRGRTRRGRPALARRAPDIVGRSTPRCGRYARHGGHRGRHRRRAPHDCAPCSSAKSPKSASADCPAAAQARRWRTTILAAAAALAIGLGALGVGLAMRPAPRRRLRSRYSPRPTCAPFPATSPAAARPRLVFSREKDAGVLGDEQRPAAQGGHRLPDVVSAPAVRSRPERWTRRPSRRRRPR